MEPPKLEEGAAEHSGDVIALRQAVSDYLAESPPVEQATELLDVLHIFVKADDVVTEEEELVLEEVTGMVAGYAAAEEGSGMHEVIIVPQNDEQMNAVSSLFPGMEPKTMRGGTVFSVGRFFSPNYADVVCERYEARGFFITRVEA